MGWNTASKRVLVGIPMPSAKEIGAVVDMTLPLAITDSLDSCGSIGDNTLKAARRNASGVKKTLRCVRYSKNRKEFQQGYATKAYVCWEKRCAASVTPPPPMNVLV